MILSTICILKLGVCLKSFIKLFLLCLVSLIVLCVAKGMTKKQMSGYSIPPPKKKSLT